MSDSPFTPVMTRTHCEPQTISVVICAYTMDRWDALEASVRSVQHQSLAPHQIIVVIDHNPVLLERARASLPGVLVTDNKETRGLSGARNSGLACATGEVVAFLDEDATAAPDWLPLLRQGYRDPYVLGVGGAIEPVWQSGRPPWFPEEFDWVVGCTYRGMPVRGAAVRNLIGCNMSFRRELFELIGGFQSGIGRVGTYPVGCEETEFCIRARQHLTHGQFRYEPRARVSHLVPSPRGRWSYFHARCYAEGLSKSLVTQLVGSQDGLASERGYTFRTLPSGIARGLTDAVCRRDAAGLQRAAAIVAGLTVTTAGYLRGTLSKRTSQITA